ncbi:MAG: hypothetical protein JSV95_04440 [Gemmatimonadota bacterium]|jgi:hypothetical protein|nr:MAG: hypothetical protein JSV95_04440 [Gemmatimonadota bacterium]
MGLHSMDDLDLGLEGSPKKAKGGRGLIVFLVGLVIGVAGTLLLPRYLGPYLPTGMGGGGETLEGPVLGKRQEDGRLLLTVQAAQGAVLATFRERVPEIDLLVDVGDTVSLGVSRYEPFVDDPAFRGIRKAVKDLPAASRPDAGIEGARPGEAASPESAGIREPGADEGRPSEAEEGPLNDSLPGG